MMTSPNPPFNPSPWAASDPIPYETRFKDSLHAVEGFLRKIIEEQCRHLQAHGIKTRDPLEPIWGLDVLERALEYSIGAGGKRLRPVLTLETGRAFGAPPHHLLPMAAAIELIHTFSLIHDDLPALDNDDLRRGRPTLHKAFDEATAILTGDALFSFAFEVFLTHTPMAFNGEEAGLPPALVVALARELAHVSGVGALIPGQMVDMAYGGRPYDSEVLSYIHRHKTGALLTFSVVSGGRLAQVEAPILKDLETYGNAIGLGFQIVDDLLDLSSDAETLGKTPGKDVTQGKATYPKLFGVEGSREKVNSLIQTAVDTLTPYQGQFAVDPLVDLAYFIRDRLR